VIKIALLVRVGVGRHYPLKKRIFTHRGALEDWPATTFRLVEEQLQKDQVEPAAKFMPNLAKMGHLYKAKCSV
jgi:hypothetical protein